MGVLSYNEFIKTGDAARFSYMDIKDASEVYMIDIDWKQYLRQHYWFGRYYWNECEKHKHYKSACESCNKGQWMVIKKDAEHNGPMYKRYAIFRMPMNNVVWVEDTDD